MSEAQFSVAYTGPGVEDGTMSVRQLAPALLAIGTAIEEANRHLNGDAASVSIRIRPATRQGSAIVDLTVQFGLAEQVAAFIQGDGMAGASQILALLGFLDPDNMVVGRISNLIDFIKAIGGKKEVARTTFDDGSTSISVEENDGTINNYTINGDVILAGDNARIVNALADTVSAVGDPRIEEFRVVDPGDPRTVRRTVDKSDEERFRVAARRVRTIDGEVQSGEFTDWVTVRKSWTVEPTRKWQFANSTGSPFNARIRDETFWEEVAADRYAITPNAKFKVRVEWEQVGDEDADHTVVAVLDYRPADPAPPTLRLSSAPDTEALPSPEDEAEGRDT